MENEPMIDPFTFKPAPTIHFGSGYINKLPDLASSFGSRLLILTGSSSLRQGSLWETLNQSLDQRDFKLFWDNIGSEPDPGSIDTIVSRFRNHEPEVVIAIGGGSVLDAGKAVSAMLPDGQPVQHYLEDVGTRLPDGRKVPFIAVPTTAGTGSEVTSNAVITKPGENGFKKSLRHDRYIPDIALIDPELMCSCPPHLTAACGMDSFTQLLEGYLSTKGSPFTDALAWTGIAAVQRSLVAAFSDGSNVQARADMAYASLCSGIVLANAGLGIIHGMAPPLGSLFSIPHGVVCGTLMAAANETILEHLDDTCSRATIKKYHRLSGLFQPGEKFPENESPHPFIETLYQMAATLGLPKLSQYGVTKEDINTIALLSDNKNNPVSLPVSAIAEILHKSI